MSDSQYCQSLWCYLLHVLQFKLIADKFLRDCKKKTLAHEFHMNHVQIPLCVLSVAKAPAELSKAGIILSFPAQLW